MKLLETIRISNGEIHNLGWHQKRVCDSIKSCFKRECNLDLEDIIKPLFPHNQSSDIKCRVIYDDTTCNVELLPYTPKPINSIRIIELPLINYAHKYADRGLFNDILLNNSDVDEVLITQNGYITDTTISNVALFDGDRWVTPSTYLLNGTTRQRLIATNVLKEIELKHTDIKSFESMRLLNAMLDFDRTDKINIDRLVNTL